MDPRALYQEVIVEHGRRPRNFGKLEGANHIARGHNPLCGDKMTLYLKVNDQGIVEDARFEGEGCAISMASASLMTEAVKGKSAEEAELMFENFHDLVMNTHEAKRPIELGKIKILAGVKDYPSRVKCATLAWHTLHNALEGGGEVSTE